ncbi:hypothetical protein GCM10028825_23630 [Spirosoma agri]
MYHFFDGIKDCARYKNNPDDRGSREAKKKDSLNLPIKIPFTTQHIYLFHKSVHLISLIKITWG